MTNKQTIDGVDSDQLKKGERLFHAGNTYNCQVGWVDFIRIEASGDARVRCDNGAVPVVMVRNLSRSAPTVDQTLVSVPLCLLESSLNGSEQEQARARNDLRILISPERCDSCDGTGDAIDLTGEWRGYCLCPAGVALKNKLAAVSVGAEPKPAQPYPNRICHVEYTAHPHLCGCTQGDEEAQRLYDERYVKASAEPKPRGEAVDLQHMAVSEGGKLRWMTGRKMQDCELYAMPDGSSIRTKLYAEQPSPVAQSTSSDQYKAELYDEVWQKARDMGFGNVTDALSKLGSPVAVVLPEQTVRRAFICKGCEGVYADEAVSKCDCMCEPDFIEGEISYAEIKP